MQHILKGGLAAAALALSVGMVQAQDLAPLNSDCRTGPDGLVRA
jgi:ribose transport system substrate-binding protein